MIVYFSNLILSKSETKLISFLSIFIVDNFKDRTFHYWMYEIKPCPWIFEQSGENASNEHSRGNICNGPSWNSEGLEFAMSWPPKESRRECSSLYSLRESNASNQLYTLYVSNGLAVGLNRCVPFWLDYVYEPFTSAFMIKFIDASVINGTVCGGCEDDIEDTCPDSMRLNYNWASKVRFILRRNGKSGIWRIAWCESFYTLWITV